MPISMGFMSGTLGRGPLMLIPALFLILFMAQQYLDQEDIVVTMAEGSIHRTGEILPPL